jgi:dTDP-4-dehydrorhamnose reductase
MTGERDLPKWAPSLDLTVLVPVLNEAAAIPWVLDLPYGIYHVAADGDCTWADFAEAIFAERGLARRIRRITTAELGRPAPRPAYSVLRSEHPGTPRLPHWRMGLAACVARL